jgi:hypothetical protein
MQHLLPYLQGRSLQSWLKPSFILETGRASKRGSHSKWCSWLQVAYAVTAAPAAGAEQLLLERHDGFTFEWGSNGATQIPKARIDSSCRYDSHSVGSYGASAKGRA